MNEKLKKYIDYFKNPKILIAIGLIGIILIFLSSFTPSKKESKTFPTEDFSVSEYKTELEKSIKNIVRQITGDRKASVVVTIEGGIEYSFAEMTEESVSQKNEDIETSNQTQQKSEYIIIKNSDGSEKAVLVFAKLPEIRGVAIVCDGGDNQVINNKISNAVTAALNITSKRVYICGRKN